jgi:hypothetical protein
LCPIFKPTPEYLAIKEVKRNLEKWEKDSFWKKNDGDIGISY